MFAILARAGAPEHEFNTLAGVLRSSRAGDTIEVRGDGPFMTEPVTVDHALTLRAAAGTRPVILLARPQGDGELFLLRATAPVVLEGLVFQGTSGASRARPWPLIQSLAKLSMANCRLLATDGRDGLWSAGAIELRNCEFSAGDVLAATAVSWSPNVAGTCVIENCVLAGKIFVPIGAERTPEAATIHLRDTTVVASRAIQISLAALPRAPGPRRTPVRVSTSGNLFACRCQVVFDQLSLPRPLEAPAAEGLFRELFDWQDERNLYDAGPGVLTLTVDLRPLAPPWDLDQWNTFWGLSRTGTRQDSIRFQGGDLIGRAAADVRQLRPEDFRLHPDSGGYGAGVNGRDLGADIDLVGPGEAYERWKQTPQYADWLKDTQPEWRASSGVLDALDPARIPPEQRFE